MKGTDSFLVVTQDTQLSSILLGSVYLQFVCKAGPAHCDCYGPRKSGFYFTLMLSNGFEHISILCNGITMSPPEPGLRVPARKGRSQEV